MNVETGSGAVEQGVVGMGKVEGEDEWEAEGKGC